MAKPNNSKTNWIWLSVLILFVCVAATTIAFLSRLDTFLLNDKGAISLLTGITSEADQHKETQSAGATATQAPTTEQTPTNTQPPVTSPTLPPITEPQVSEPPKNPGFEMEDDNAVWGTNTQVDIFRISYVNGEQVITVNSGDGQKIIAPGTENSYTFKLKNTGDVALDYIVEVDAHFIPGNIQIPITARLNRYDGKWIVGDKDSYIDVPTLDTAEDRWVLGAGRYAYYTLDWCWPFESGNDELDTQLGNLATEQDLVFVIVIKTTAVESEDPSGGGGIIPPQTGDRVNLPLLLGIAIGSFVIMMVLLVYLVKDRRRDDSEAKTVEDNEQEEHHP